MPRPLSDASIQHRVLIAYHLAQGLARNPGYQRDIADLRAAHDAAVTAALHELRTATHVISPDLLRPVRRCASPPQPTAWRHLAVEPSPEGRCPGLFDSDGFENPHPWDRFAEQAQKVRDRAGLRLLVLPARLRALTLEEIEAYWRRPLFVFVPGWDRIRIAARP